ncbi:MAG: c-type cytochrome, partial [Bryobacteraceae bacterium]
RHYGIVTGLVGISMRLGLAPKSALVALCSFLFCIAAVAQAPKPPTAASKKAAPARVSRSIVAADFTKIDPAAVKQGQTIFESHCAFCHGANARGGESGPDLLRSDVVLNDVKGKKIAPIVHGARVSQGMPKFDLSMQQIQDIAAFLHQSIQNAALRGTYKILNVVTGNPQAGEAYFNGAGRCNTCHSATGDLAHIGSKYKPEQLQQRFLMPREHHWPPRPGPAANPVIATVTLSNGKTFTGALDHIDDFNIALTDSNGDYHSFTRSGDVPNVTLKDPLAFHKEMLTKYTDADIHNLTAYLVSLK